MEPLTQAPSPVELAALDLGSNSFHLIVARESGQRLQIVDKIREMVRLAEGLDARQQLSETASRRALDCLERFGQRLRHLRQQNVRVVGTNALRRAHNADAFIAEAEQALGHRVEVISGREEARLIYLGVSHALEDNQGNRLVIDVGGGSTEIILGRRFEPTLMESIHTGCVSVSQRWFADGATSREAFRGAIDECRLLLAGIRSAYLSAGWELAVGASGTILAAQNVLAEMHGSEIISRAGLHELIERMIQAGNLAWVDLQVLSPERLAVFAGGMAVLEAVMETFELQSLQISEGALREGLLHDLLGRVHHDDVRDQSVQNLMLRYHIDTAHAKRIRETALSFLAQVAIDWRLHAPAHRQLLAWAADLHEIGRDIAHSQYHRHGGYLLAHMDMAGFSRRDQSQLATLVRLHRRKFATDREAPEPPIHIRRLAVLLRLAVILQRSRASAPLPHIAASAENGKIILTLPSDWLADQPLTKLDLKEEASFLADAGFNLSIRTS